ncbi:hypothetical protein GOP47_0016822 [Adiantum capillus-veneris]|uniref:Glycosyltransferase n=1 Tax=Adiantum capillus-veneris TaxID=13818 RepID=A0A9D4UIS7_ADICA|nr:hypothetical protein GOP47_0016822 [Adiantum capillus-veneris]
MAFDLSAHLHHYVAPHVLVVPYPAQGHTNPALSVAKFLADNGISITLVQATNGLLPQIPSHSVHGNQALKIFRKETIPSGLDHSKPLSGAVLKVSFDVMRAALRELLQKLMLEENPPICLLIDSFFGWGNDIAVEFGLSRVDLWTSSATTFYLGIHVQDLVTRGFIPATEEGAKEKIVDFLPGLSPLRVADMPQNLIPEEGLQSGMFIRFRSVIQSAKWADRILINTMYELDTNVIECLRREDHIHIDPVGPLHVDVMSVAPNSSVSLVQQDDHCLSLLDRQQQSSVLYCAFGSLASIDENVVAELAHGLEASGESFLWVIRPDKYKNNASVEEILPEGFMERTRDRGLVISWAPQLSVLGHSSVGAFLTHCGWNSVLESLSNGVPMLGFPQMAEQNTNLKLIVHDWKVGLPLLQQEVNTQKVERKHVQRAITAIMRGDEGLQIRMRAREWKEIAEKAIHGSSKDNLQKLVDDLKQGKLKHPKY